MLIAIPLPGLSFERLVCNECEMGDEDCACCVSRKNLDRKQVPELDL
jgi:hypothetical protein